MKQPPLRWSDAAWVSLATAIVTYDLLAPDGEQFSDAADRYSMCHPWITRLVIAATVGHLTRVIPSYLDVFHLPDVIRRQVKHSVQHGEVGGQIAAH